jgi:peptide/nickel transport system substrate-binding protein
MTRLALAAALALTLACRAQPLPSSGPIVIALANSPTNLDPAVGLDESSQKLHQLLYRSLLKTDEHLRVVPDLAIRFETTDARTYVAEIPRGVRFHDGREMTSEDVAYTFRRFLDAAFVSGRKGAYSALAAIDIVDRYTVAFQLKSPSASFPINLIMGIVPAGAGASSARRPVGSGPYRLKAFVPDDHVALDPFPDAYGGAPDNAGLIFKVVPDETMRGLELRNRSVDLVVNDLSPDLVHGLEQTAGLTVTTGPGTDYAYIGFNLRDPLLADPRVRWAIGSAVDTAAIIAHLRRGLARPATGIVPSMSWAYEGGVRTFPHDAAEARRLLDEAGFPDPDGPGPQPRLHLTLKTSTDERYRLQAAVIQQNLAEAGIAVDIRSYEFATLMADVVRGNVQLYTLQYVGVTDPDMLRRAFHSSQTPPAGFNRGHYANTRVDALLERAAAAQGDTERRALYAQVQRIVAEDAPYISLWAKTNVAVFQRGLTGVTLSPTADFAFLSRVHRQ